MNYQKLNFSRPKLKNHLINLIPNNFFRVLQFINNSNLKIWHTMKTKMMIKSLMVFAFSIMFSSLFAQDTTSFKTYYEDGITKYKAKKGEPSHWHKRYSKIELTHANLGKWSKTFLKWFKWINFKVIYI